MTMTLSQQIFVVFFAIFWGTSANAWPQRKPFHWSFFFDSWRIVGRVTWSVLILNIVPLAFFACVYLQLSSDGGASASDWHPVVRGTVPAFGIFGIYRLWLVGIELGHKVFYYANDDEMTKCGKALLVGRDPTATCLKLSGERWGTNLFFGLLYVVVAAGALRWIPPQ